jgi:phosphomannomutase/phosphoglucomutase
MSIYREYDIRGVVGDALTYPLATEVGRAFGTYVRRRGGPRIVLGRDVRLSSEPLRDALVEGLISTGMEVIDVGECTTPILYFSLFNFPVDGGVMITGSHNPAEFNGFKLCLGKGTLFGEEIQKIRTMVEEKDFDSGSGRLSLGSIVPEYVRYLAKNAIVPSPAGRDPLKVVLDCGNGAAAIAAPKFFREMGVDLTELYCTPDGRFPNHHPDPTVVENLKDLIAAVREKEADVGIAFDGDADRIGVVDERGKVIFGDRLMILFAREILKERPGATFISEVKASQVLYDEIARLGGKPIMWKTGHSLIKAKMKETGALLAGEMSGHMFFADRYFGYDDALYAAGRLIEILRATDRPLSELLSDLPETYATPEIRVDCPDDQKFALVDRCRRALSEKHKIIDVDGVRVLFDDGWGLVRASNTQPALVLRFEAGSERKLAEIQTYVEGILEREKARAS